MDKLSREDRAQRLFQLYPLGSIPRQDWPKILGYKANYAAALAAEGKGPPFYKRGKICMYPIHELLDWLEKKEKPRRAEPGLKRKA